MAAVTMISILSVSAVFALTQIDEYEVKAEFLERFTRFIEWPNAHWQNTETPFVIGIIGNDPFGPGLDSRASHWKIKDRRVEIRKLARPSEAAACDLVFISKSARPPLESIIASTADLPILTISDSPGFAQRGVLINFYLAEDETVRFEINVAAVKRSGLDVRSRLLKLARLVNSSNDLAPARGGEQ